ncbi:DNA polymerase III subunit delta [Engelhardtia mirabilis]|uniref:DNA polymerase III subunit delta n=1 Tax=Engelhardtia mirabilis TaxID=2528011 RepID=A0A518BJB2_9BACT|nr:DNA polymerase III subunit delta [Planctomycetes bacterium Pla133]QDV01379.1 DNA polymerase III subunit delta [Planctomycetes bacterium Pla86]
MATAKKRESPPHVQVAAFEKSLAVASQLAAGYLVRGDEGYFRRRVLDALRSRSEALDVEVVVHDASDPDFDPQVLLGDLATPPMFASAQLIIAREVDGLLKKVGSKDSPFVRGILSFLERAEAGRSVAIAANAMRADQAIAKRFAKLELPSLSVRRLWDSPPPWNPDPRQVELVQWLVARARELGVRLDPDQAVYVVAATGNDLDAIEDQLERLRHGGQRALQEVIRWQAGGSPFAVADHLCRGDLPRAVDAIESLFQGGMTGRDGGKVVDRAALGAILIGSLARGVRQGLAAARDVERGVPPAGAAAKAGAGGERAKTELLERLRRRPSAAEWARMLEDLADVDRRAKSGAGVDASDFTSLALAWSAPAQPGRR